MTFGTLPILGRQFPVGGSRVLDYDSSNNGSSAQVFSVGSTPPDYFDSDYENGVFGFVGGAAGSPRIVIGTLSGTAVTWGTGVAIAGVKTGAYARIAMLTSSLAAVIYHDSSNNVICKTYTISGTTPTLD